MSIDKVLRIVKGSVNADITLDIGDGKLVRTIIINTSAIDLGLKKDDMACVLFKAPSVMLLSVMLLKDE